MSSLYSTRFLFRLAFRAARMDTAAFPGTPYHIAQAACDVDRKEEEPTAFVDRAPLRVKGKSKYKAVYSAQDALRATQWARYKEKKGAYAA